MRSIVKVRRVAGSIVIGLTKPILEVFQVKDGDRVMVSTRGSNLVVTKEVGSNESIKRRTRGRKAE